MPTFAWRVRILRSYFFWYGRHQQLTDGLPLSLPSTLPKTKPPPRHGTLTPPPHLTHTPSLFHLPTLHTPLHRFGPALPPTICHRPRRCRHHRRSFTERRARAQEGWLSEHKERQTPGEDRVRCLWRKQARLTRPHLRPTRSKLTRVHFSSRCSSGRRTRRWSPPWRA